MIRTGQPNAAAKSNPTQPGAKFPGSDKGPLLPTMPGYPSETASNFQSAVFSPTCCTSVDGDNCLPERNFRGSVSPVSNNFTFAPPTSTTRIRRGPNSEFLLSVGCLMSRSEVASTDVGRVAIVLGIC